MNSKPSAAIRNNYNEESELCKSSGESVYLTEKGEGDLVITDIESFTRREKMLALRDELQIVQEDRLLGVPDFTIDEVVARMEESVNNTVDRRAE